mmetsp:Transcript_55046/g.98050  ORF Transcript_55046/g.98050 Transcript_55046/m.98050 type:complete len:179 (-) Transcript_55046:233-769(-)
MPRKGPGKKGPHKARGGKKTKHPDDLQLGQLKGLLKRNLKRHEKKQASKATQDTAPQKDTETMSVGAMKPLEAKSVTAHTQRVRLREKLLEMRKRHKGLTKVTSAKAKKRKVSKLNPLKKSIRKTARELKGLERKGVKEMVAAAEATASSKQKRIVLTTKSRKEARQKLVAQRRAGPT